MKSMLQTGTVMHSIMVTDYTSTPYVSLPFLQGKTVRGLIIVNPHNPTGNIVRQHKLLEMLEFCAQSVGLLCSQ